MEPIVTESPSVLARQLSVYGIPYPASSTERRKNKVVKTYGVVWREPDRTSSAYRSRSTQTSRGAEVMRAWRETYSARRATRKGPAPWPSTRGGELPFGYDAAGSTRRR